MAKYEMTDQGLGRRVLVTGASAGIGRAFAKVFAENAFDLVVTARREDRLQQLAEELHEKFETNTHIIPADLSNPETPQRLYEETEGRGMDIDALVNNAGFGVPGYFTNTTWTDQASSLQVMVTAPAQLCHLFLPAMLERKYGRIVNLASMAGLLPSSPGQTLYGGEKAFLIKLSETLWAESQGRGVNVTAVCPGLTYSEFHDVAHSREHANQMPSWLWIDANTVARQGYEAVMAGKPIEVNGAISKAITMLTKLLPRRLVVETFTNRSRRNHRGRP